MYNVHLPIMLESERQAVYRERKKEKSAERHTRSKKRPSAITPDSHPKFGLICDKLAICSGCTILFCSSRFAPDMFGRVSEVFRVGRTYIKDKISC